MSTFTSQAIRKRDASPTERMNPEESRGILKTAIGIQQIPIAGAGTFAKLISIPSNARLVSLDYIRQNLGTSTLDISVFYPTTIPQGGAGSVAKSSEGAIFGSSNFINNIIGTDAAIAWTTGFGLAVTPAMGALDNPLWQVLALTEDPEGEIDIGFSVRAATATAGYVGLRATYVD